MKCFYGILTYTIYFDTPFEYTDLMGLEDVRRYPHSFTLESSPLYHLQEDDGAVI